MKRKAKINKIFISVNATDDNGATILMSDNVEKKDVGRFIRSCEVRIGLDEK